jgi:VirB8 protein
MRRARSSAGADEQFPQLRFRLPTRLRADVPLMRVRFLNSFHVEWVERRYADNALTATERWSAILTIVVQTPTD